MYDFNLSFKEALFKKRERRAYILITFFGMTKRINEWSEFTGIGRDALWRRYARGLNNDGIFREFIKNNY